jgi:hypothetical protein
MSTLILIVLSDCGQRINSTRIVAFAHVCALRLGLGLDREYDFSSCRVNSGGPGLGRGKEIVRDGSVGPELLIVVLLRWKRILCVKARFAYHRLWSIPPSRL